MLVLLVVMSPFAVVCGARTGLDVNAADGEGDAGSADVGQLDALDDSEAGGAAPCSSWAGTHAPVQISQPTGNMALQATLVESSCATVGYANNNSPLIDPYWRVRQVFFADGSLGEAYAVLPHDGSELGWTKISLAQGFGRAGATAWDRASGMLFTSIDKTGGATGSPVVTSPLPGRALLTTPAGYTVLQAPFDGVRAPVVLTTLDPSGQIVGPSRQLIDDSSTVAMVSRLAFGDRSFLLLWLAEHPCPECRTLYAQHFSETGDELAPRIVVHAFAAGDYRRYAAAVSAVGFVAAWFEEIETGRLVSIAAFDADGESLGPPRVLTSMAGLFSETVALGTAPAGDVIAAWSQREEPQDVELVVQALTATGDARGEEVIVGTRRPTNNGRMQIVASSNGAMLVYENAVTSVGDQVFAIPLQCQR